MNLSRLASLAPTPDDTAWYDVIGRFKNYAQEFENRYRNLQSKHIDAAKYPELANDQLDLLRRGTEVKSTIQSITGAVDDAWSWLKNTFGFDGIRQMDTQMGTMGIPIVIPIAVVSGAVALIYKWNLNSDEFEKRYAFMRDMEAKGYSARQIRDMMEGLTTSKPLINFGGSTTLLIIGGLGLLAYINRDKLRLG